jgi:hypothetical protein
VQELDSLFRDAEQLATDVRSRLARRESADRLVPQLRDLNSAVQSFQEKLGALVPVFDQLPPEDREVIRSLQQSIPELLHLVKDNYQVASSAGLPITGIGGKPYRPQPQRARLAKSKPS